MSVISGRQVLPKESRTHFPPTSAPSISCLVAQSIEPPHPFALPANKTSPTKLTGANQTSPTAPVAGLTQATVQHVRDMPINTWMKESTNSTTNEHTFCFCLDLECSGYADFMVAKITELSETIGARTNELKVQVFAGPGIQDEFGRSFEEAVCMRLVVRPKREGEN